MLNVNKLLREGKRIKTMPENRTRHTCAVCGIKRYEEYMKAVGYYGQGLVWVCDHTRYKNVWTYNGDKLCLDQYVRPPTVIPI